MPSLESTFIRLRAYLLAYRYADFSHQQHQNIVDALAKRYAAAIYDEKDSERRMVARSVVQYLGQSALRPRKSRVITAIVAWALLPMCLIFGSLSGLINCAPNATKVKGVRWLKSRFRYDVTPDIYHTPEELKGDAPSVAHSPLRYLRRDDIFFLLRVYWQAWKLLRRPHIQWCYKITKEICWIRPLIEYYPSSYVLMEDECNCALSVMTLYAHVHDHELYVVQHGDLFISASVAFFETDRAYCWNSFYVDILKKLYAQADFRVYQNPSFMLNHEEKSIIPEGVGVFQPSFLTLPTPQQREQFAAQIRKLSAHVSVELRPHPSFINEYEQMAPLYGNRVVLSHPSTETAKHFALRHALVIGTLTTALLESAIIGRDTICARGGYVDDTAEYHFAFALPNCRLCDLNTIADEAMRILVREGSQSVV